ncbi:hypothetical protein [Streptomyces sp. NPDC048419]|uniref:hypothetical protein n=1 Tax=Streptomyces sp. NPDC048419 TaxID=3365547 RepID=UPI003720A5C0
MGALWEWNDWQQRLLGAEDEDLSQVFTRVKVHTLRETQIKWAIHKRTRAFCDLALHLLYQHHLADGARAALGGEVKLFRNLGPEDLMRHAARVVPDAREAEGLDRQRWLDTWRFQAAFLDDLVAYLFRPSVVQRRIGAVHEVLLTMAPQLTLGQLIREGTAAELQSTLHEPIVGLQTFIQAALPRQPRIRQYIDAMEVMSLTQWAHLYERVLPGYGLALRPGVTWHDLARLFDTVIEGVLLKARTHDDIPCVESGDNTLAAAIFAMLPSLCTIDRADIDTRTLQHPLHPTASPDRNQPTPAG